MEKFIELLEKTKNLRSTPPANTIAHIFRHDYKENFISDWLAFLINPGNTGSTQPLAALLRLALGTEPEEITDVSVIREHTFEDQRRIDFYIESKYYVIGIENKIRSGLQPNQLRDYEKQLSAKRILQGKELVLILLCPQSNPLCSDRDLKLGKFRLVTYEDLVEQFKMIRLNLFENMRAAFLMEDFILHMEEYVMGKNETTEENLQMLRFEAEYRKELERLLKAIDDSKKQFGACIHKGLADISQSREDRDEWAAPSIHSTYFQLYKEKWKKAQVHFELLAKGGFPPTEMQVVLHTREQGKNGKSPELYNLQELVTEELKQKHGRDTFTIRYDAFGESMDAIFGILAELVHRYTDAVDRGIR